MASDYLIHTGINSDTATPLRIAGADGARFRLEDGRDVIDASNTAGSLGHQHPAIIAAVRDAAASPVVNEGWFWPDRESAARDLVEIAFAQDTDWVGAVRFFLSGSEANDLALSLCQALTGRTRLVTRERAYHGMTGLARDMTVQPHWHGGLSAASGGVQTVPRTADVQQLSAPRGARIGDAPRRVDAAALASTLPLLDEAAAVILDYSQGGIYHSAEYQDTVAAAAKDAGALWIADEVVTAFGRIGGWFAFQRGDSRPDVVTLGKLLSAGAAPAGAVVLSKETLRQLDGKQWQTYSTFRGHPLTVAAIRAHLRVLADTGLVTRASEVDGWLCQRFEAIAAKHPSVSRIDGEGLHWSIELHGPDWREWRGDVAEAPLATRVANRALDAGALFGTSGEQTSVFFAPPLISTDEELEEALFALDRGLEVADEELAQAAVVA
jgi:4-aminobutyrate aminotransferase-like enzyme